MFMHDADIIAYIGKNITEDIFDVEEVGNEIYVCRCIIM